MCIHDRRRLLPLIFPRVSLFYDHRTPLAVSPRIVSLQEKKIKRRYDDDRFVFKNIFSRSLRSLFLRITIPSGRDIEAHRGFSVIWSSRNPSPQKCYVCVCVIIDLSSPILNYESPSKRRLFQIHACDMNRWYIVTRGVKISIFLPDVQKILSCPLRFRFFDPVVPRR